MCGSEVLVSAFLPCREDPGLIKREATTGGQTCLSGG